MKYSTFGAAPTDCTCRSASQDRPQSIEARFLPAEPAPPWYSQAPYSPRWKDQDSHLANVTSLATYSYSLQRPAPQLYYRSITRSKIASSHSLDLCPL
ncbi:hypothetical protein C8Q75DRAFT_777590 [Abortiporus biennis]|nr:hypothetical protein C8Q75DRAFT_777590 [Abortiporus biennis]